MMRVVDRTFATQLFNEALQVARLLFDQTVDLDAEILLQC